MKKNDTPLCGIDEAGRGPLAGPLIMAGVILLHPIENLADSKKLSEAKRNALFEKIVSTARFIVIRFSAEQIDSFGIGSCIKRGLVEICTHFGEHVHYLFDGNTSFGVANIQTLVKADSKVPEVSAASILAKVTRDREMVSLARKYPDYGFEKHKGYAVKSHYEALLKHGRCPIHRKSFYIKGVDDLFS